MSRKGYSGEYRTKKMLIEEYGELGVLKQAIGANGADFMCIRNGVIDKLVEVKETVQDKYYPKKREKKQFEEIRKFAAFHGVKAELWIIYKHGSGHPVDIKVLDLFKTHY